MSARSVSVVFGVFAVLMGVSDIARAVVPPYAEEWLVPASPQDVEVDPSGRVWVSCADDSIRVYAPTGGQLLFTFGGSGAGDGEFVNPYGIAFDPSGDAYICDYINARVEKFASDGTFLFSWPVASPRADHVAVDAAGDVYVTGYIFYSVHKYDSTGAPLLDWVTSELNQTSGIVVADGVAHVVTWDAPVVEQFATDGTFLASFGSNAINGVDIEIDALGQLWVADYGSHVVRTFTTDGVPIDVLGSNGSGPGEFDLPIGIGIGLDGSVYVGDEVGGRIQRFGDPVTSSAPDEGALRASLAFRSIAPNPSREAVAITYALDRSEPVLLTVTDISGRTVATLENRTMSAGEHRVVWGTSDDRGRPVAAGLYLARLANGGASRVARMLVVR